MGYNYTRALTEAIQDFWATFEAVTGDFAEDFDAAAICSEYTSDTVVDLKDGTFSYVPEMVSADEFNAMLQRYER